MATRKAVEIAVYAGTFESQPLVFAHLYDLATALGIEMALDEIDVICKTDPTPRLAHYFDAETVDVITANLGLFTTTILVFPEALAGDLEGSTRITALGKYQGSRVRA
ncbi:MAG: hypothetical protein AAGI10_14120 [Pseudomonadota bacterium]